MSEWMPIETAPKDGRPILVCGLVPELIGSLLSQHSKMRMALGVVHYALSTWEEDEPVGDGLFRKISKRRDSWRAHPDNPYAMGVSNPLYWMPLPELPKVAKSPAKVQS